MVAHVVIDVVYPYRESHAAEEFSKVITWRSRHLRDSSSQLCVGDDLAHSGGNEAICGKVGDSVSPVPVELSRYQNTSIFIDSVEVGFRNVDVSISR